LIKSGRFFSSVSVFVLSVFVLLRAFVVNLSSSAVSPFQSSSDGLLKECRAVDRRGGMPEDAPVGALVPPACRSRSSYMTRPIEWFLLASLCLAPAARCPAQPPQPVDEREAGSEAAAASTEDDDGWQSLFDGESLGAWKDSEFGTGGNIEVRDGTIVLGFADGCNGITWREEFPEADYEIRLEAMRVDGNDFFCGLTFPVGESPCTLIVGGWGGAVVGLSSIDGQDASENETTTPMRFKRGRWYPIRLRVTAGRITAWIDDEQVVDLATEGRKISIRPEVERSKPLGIASWCTTAALRGIEMRRIEPEAAEPDAAEPDATGPSD